MSYSYLFKFIVIGDIGKIHLLFTNNNNKIKGVGKSALLTQFIENQFYPKYSMTVGIEFVSRTITIDDMIIKLQIWDTSGQENFQSITRSYYRSIAGVILVYDITNRDSFLHVLKWFDEVKTYGNDDMTFILIGNKNDLIIERAVFFDEGKDIADKNGFLFLETSAKTGENVEQTFLRTSFEIYKKALNSGKESQGVKIGNLIGNLNNNDKLNKESFFLKEKVPEYKSSQNYCCN